MIDSLYIQRVLVCEDKTFSEEELLEAASVIVVLAEPGAGKTRLLESLARRLGVKPQKASVFRHQRKTLHKVSLVLDALDEVAKLDPSAIDALLVKAEESKAKQLVLASRSSEWEEARSIRIRDCFGSEPKIVRIRPFDEVEQKEFFEYHQAGADFEKFRRELGRFDLAPLLGNPQFLLLFSEAFVEGGCVFSSKKKIFEDAVRRLTHVSAGGVPQKTGPTAGEQIAWANEVFAKLLLSGAVGVCTVDALDDRAFPRITSLTRGNSKAVSILDTRLFKPSDNQNQHEPVHRIVSEYGAAHYLSSRISDSSDPFSLQQCLAVVAPNSVVRDELRGLIGWMAAVGDQALQEAAIDLDPYAVLANGDPSQLLLQCRKRLLAGLQRVAEHDPYFRRGDVWRTFSASGFFTREIVDDLRRRLSEAGEDGHLRGLLLELLEGSDAIPMLTAELQSLLLDPDCGTDTRVLAHRCLISVPDRNHLKDCKALIVEGSEDALFIAAKTYQRLGVCKLGRHDLLDLFLKIARLYSERSRRVIGRRYFVKELARTLDLSVIEWLLDELTEGLQCTCGETAYKCNCRNGISKVIGLLLDCYFETCNGPFDPVKIWEWIGNLNFHEGISADRSASVRALQTNHILRQGIQRHALLHCSNKEEILNIRMYSFDHQSHSGLRFQPEDRWVIADLAFQIGNLELWSSFLAPHIPYVSKHEPDYLRRHMRRQARQKPEFLRLWAKLNRSSYGDSKQYRTSARQLSRNAKRRRRRDERIRQDNIRYLKANRALIEGGLHVGWLIRFAELYLMRPDLIPEEVDDAELPERVLRNCLPFIEPKLPSLQRLAELQCASQYNTIETILYAACLAIFRDSGTLDGVPRESLAALKTNIDMSYGVVDNDEKDDFEQEVDRNLFREIDDAESFARDYIEPQLKIARCAHANVDWLRYKRVFEPLRRTLPIEWLTRFPRLSEPARSTLFDLSAQYADRDELQALVAARCDEFLDLWPNKTDDEELEDARNFWFLRHFFFVGGDQEVIWKWLSSDDDMIFALEHRAGRFNRSENVGWPDLSAERVYNVLDAFIERWPKVHLPNSWGSESPKGEKAYRFLTDIVWTIEKDEPTSSLPVLNRLLTDDRFFDFHTTAQALRASALRRRALRDFEAPTPTEIVDLLDRNKAATVEGLRTTLLEELAEFQRAILGSEFDPVEKFYDGGQRLDENTASKRIAEHLQIRLNSQNMSIDIEHQLKNGSRCDIAASKMIGGARRLLVIEVKGQWHPELFTAAAAQLYERYSVHPDAEHQGIYLVLWFGGKEKLAGRVNVLTSTPGELQEKIVSSIPEDLRAFIDVFVLDLSKK